MTTMARAGDAANGSAATAATSTTASFRPQPGPHDRLGATIRDDGVDFVVYAKRAIGLDLLLFDGPDDLEPGVEIAFDDPGYRTGDYWHMHVPGIGAGQHYGFRANGPWAPADGLRFDPRRVLLDPYGRGVATPAGYRRVPAGEDPAGVPAMKSVVIDLDRYDWEGDAPIGRPFQHTVIYEAHLAGFTADPSSGLPADRRGTYRGFIDKIPYLVGLGITAVELLPVFQFDRLAAPAGLINHWGYQPVAFFAPHAQYAAARTPVAAVDEFRDLVKALHRAGIEVILDVVYNHTAETGPDGPTFSFRGLADDDYYLLGDDGTYIDESGCGNTLDPYGAVTRRLITDSLRFWVSEMHVDGFRFDLAAVLSRDSSGARLADPPILWEIETDPVLAGTKLIAEAWDAGGLYEVGDFVGDRWSEWNGRFRDDVRAFIRGDDGTVRAVSQRFLGSPDIYGHKKREPGASVNFVTCHDGFTLEDLVSYDHKHNEANGEDGRDGSDQNTSWNCGVEGPTDDPAIEALRRRQVRNFLAFELLSLGAPMLSMGDEVRRTQGGNNNAYCHDDPTSWFDWTGVERHADILRFTTTLIAIRRRLRTILEVPPDKELLDILAEASLAWSGVRVGQPDLADDSHTIALTIRAGQGALHLIFNAWQESLAFELPEPGDGISGWRRIIDTMLDAPDDIAPDFDAAPDVDGTAYEAGPRSVVLLAARAIDVTGPRREP
jgi:glycogen operon protein